MKANLAVVLVTFNRFELLTESIKMIESQTLLPDCLIVVNNASTDNKTKYFLDNYSGILNLIAIHNTQNTGGAGGFYSGIKSAYENGFEWIFVMDDDVFAHQDCLKILMTVSHPCMIAVREYRDGNLVERAAIKYNLSNPFLLNPKRLSICDAYLDRKQLPNTLEVENIAFEGFMVHREVVGKIGYPEPNYFIFYDDVDYSLRARRAGYSILAVRDAVLVRQLPFDQNASLKSWKALYMFRNLFYIHYKFGSNFFVKIKPYWLMVFCMIYYPMRLKSISIIGKIFMAFRSYKNIDKS